MNIIHKVVKTIHGHQFGDVIDQFSDIEDARRQLATELRYAANDDYQYFACKADAEAEIAFAEEAREDWGVDRADAYINALREGIESGTPFVADSVNGDCITTQYDSFSYDNYTVEIITEEEGEDM